MGQLIVVAVAAVVPSIVFGIFMFFHTRGERSLVSTLAEDAFRHLAARDAKDAATAKATALYQEEAIREQKVEFDRHEKEIAKLGDIKQTDPNFVTGPDGKEWEILSG